MLFLLLWGYITYYTYDLVGWESPPVNTNIEGLYLMFTIETTPHFRTNRDPYTLKITFVDFKNKYRMIRIRNINLVTENKCEDLMEKLEKISVPTDGRNSKYLNELEFNNFLYNKTIYLDKDEMFPSRDILFWFNDLGIKYDDVETFDIIVDLDIETFDNNITNALKNYTFIRKSYRVKNSPST
jgi:hypothetical protein